MRRLITVLSVICFLSTGVAQGKIWVATDGKDSNAGTKSKPLLTLTKAQKIARKQCGAEVVVRGGVYNLSEPLRFTAQDSGCQGRQTVYHAYQNERVTLSGAYNVKPGLWHKYRDGIWRAKVGPVQSRELFVDGERATRAATQSYPAGFLPNYSEGGIQYKTTDLNPASYRDPSHWQGVDQVEAVLLTQWKMIRTPLQGVQPADTESGLLTVRQPAWDNANLFRDATGKPGLWSMWQVSWFENSLSFLDQSGEWYLAENGYLYYKPRPGELLSNASVKLGVTEQLLVAHGSAQHPIHDLSFRGFRFAHSGWLAPSGKQGYVADQGGLLITGSQQPNQIGHIQTPQPTPATVSFKFTEDIKLVGNSFEHLGPVAVSLGRGSKGNVVRANSFSDIGSSAITLGGIAAADHQPSEAQLVEGNRLQRNMITDIGVQYNDAPAIFVGFTRDSRIVDNVIDSVPWSGIAVGWGWGLLDPSQFPGLPHATAGQWGDWPGPVVNSDNVIAHNQISNFLQKLWDGGAIYTTGQQGSGWEDALLIKDNIAFNKQPEAGGNTFYTDGGSRFIIVKDNISYNNPIGKMYFGPAPQAGDPLPYPSEPSLANGMPYGSDIGGCVTYGQIVYQDNSWMQAPMQSQMPVYNDLFELFTAGKLRPYSEQGFFDICPYSQDGVSYPRSLHFQGNSIYE